MGRGAPTWLSTRLGSSVLTSNSSLDLLGVPALAALLASVESRLVSTCSVGVPELSAASVRIVAAGGKRLRPALAIAVARLANVFDARVVAAATAVELVQVGSLVHDDIFDEAQTRRGTPTINAVEGRNEALFSGTYLLARAGAEAASAGRRAAADAARTVAQLCRDRPPRLSTCSTSIRTWTGTSSPSRRRLRRSSPAPVGLGRTVRICPRDRFTILASSAELRNGVPDH